MLHKIARLFSKRGDSRSVLDDLKSLGREGESYLIATETLAADQLLNRYPPQIEHAKKRLLFDLVLPDAEGGSASVSRYREITIPTTYQPFAPSTDVVARKGYFRYANSDGIDDWFMNFAHHDLFSGYGHFMFAQDEVQVAEHPVLASFREMMTTRTDGLQPMTVEYGSPTPVLFRSVQRVARIDTRSIYGARFARSDEATIRDAVIPISPPTFSNILAIEAPVSSGNRTYIRSEIEAALRTAYSGFRAVVFDSAVNAVPAAPVVVHTGSWGCGAYGGNRQLMLSIQMIAARLAGISQVVVYCGLDREDDVGKFETELRRRFKFKPGVSVGKVIDRLAAAAFPWGTPDGN